MKVIEDVCMALLFLGEERLIHRDLKEVNIMVDRYHRGRLIDFGSVSNVTGSSKFKTKDEKVRSTAGYYLPYRDAVGTCPALEQQMSRNDYYSH
jgi:serine/threonine protein kinase